MTNQLILNYQHKMLQPESDFIRPLWDVVHDFMDGRICLPDHQRQERWGQEQQKEWIADLRTRRPIGLIVTYQITEESLGDSIFLNDGRQRLGATAKYVDNPEAYGDTRDQMEKFLRAQQISMQHRHYRTHIDAMRDFQRLNQGVSLTHAEFNHGFLTYMPRYDRLWRPLFERILARHDHWTSVLAKKTSNDKFKRDTYANIYRYIEGKNQPKHVNVTSKVSRTRTPVERALADKLNDVCSPEAEQMVDRFVNSLDRYGALIERVWFDEMNKGRGYGMAPAVARCLLSTGFYLQAVEEAYVNKYHDAIRLVLSLGDGASRFELGDSPRSNTKSIQLQRVDQVLLLAKMEGIDLQRKRQRGRMRLRAGYDQSHVVPFSVVGNGQTVAEPAALNRSRGAFPISVQGSG